MKCVQCYFRSYAIYLIIFLFVAIGCKYSKNYIFYFYLTFFIIFFSQYPPSMLSTEWTKACLKKFRITKWVPYGLMLLRQKALLIAIDPSDFNFLSS